MNDNKRIGARIKKRREELGLTQEDLGNQLFMNKSTIQRYETGKVEKIKIPVIHALAKALNVDPNWIALKTDEMGMFESGREWYKRDIGNYSVDELPDNIIPLPKTKKIPLLGTIACGEPILATENIDKYIEMPESVGGTFALKCKGDSMINAHIFDGDVVYIREQPDVENGEIAAVLIRDEATLKRVYKYPSKVVLRPENPLYNDITYTEEEMNDVRILGKAVAHLSAVR